MERSSTLSLARLDVRPRIKQHLHDFSVPPTRRLVNRAPRILIFCFQVGSMSKEDLHGAGLSERSATDHKASCRFSSGLQGPRRGLSTALPR